MKASLSFDTQSNPEAVLIRVERLDPALRGHEAKLTITAHATVHDSRAVNDKKELFVQKFRLDAKVSQLTLPRAAFPCYVYRGTHVDVDVRMELRIDDGIVFDTKVKQELVLQGPARNNEPTCAKHLVEPQDTFRFWQNWRAIPAPNKVIALALAAAVILVAIINSALGVHDQFAPEAKTFFYSHRDSDGGSESPLVNSTGVTGLIAAVLWLALLKQLRQYMKFGKGKRPLGRIGRDTKVVVGDLFSGRSRVPLHDVALRIVACNIENGQYTRGSGKSSRTESFAEPVGGLVLFEKRVSVIKPGAAVEDSFPETVDFAPMFDALLPPNLISDTHGVDVHWEIQLVHDRLVDQELVGDTSGLVREDFYGRQLPESLLYAPLPAEFR